MAVVTTSASAASATPVRSAGERRLIVALRWALKLYLLLTSEARGRARFDATTPLTVLLTGTFYSANWAAAHLGPLTRSSRVARVIVVSTFPLPDGDGVSVVAPPQWLQAIAGGVVARLLTFGWLAVRERPHVVGGFHLLFNGMVATVVGRLVGAATLYFCGGGAAEVLGGGIRSENRLFGTLSSPELELERLLIETTKRFDLIVTMGTGAAAFFTAQGVPGLVMVNGGGIDTDRFWPGTVADKDIDVLFVGRLAQIKRVERILHMAALLAPAFPQLRIVLVGEGELMADLRRLATTLGVAAHVEFAGRQSDVGSFLRRTRVFILTSESEGVALSMLEAMTSGVAPVVSDVGDLSDVIEEGKSGYLVADQQAETFAARVAVLLHDEAALAAMGAAATRRAARYSIASSTALWNDAFATLSQHRAA